MCKARQMLNSIDGTVLCNFPSCNSKIHQKEVTLHIHSTGMHVYIWTFRKYLHQKYVSFTDKASNKKVFQSGSEFRYSVNRVRAHRGNSGTCAKLISEDFKLKVQNVMSLLAPSPEILILYLHLFLSSQCFAA